MTSENEQLVIVLQLKEGIGFNKGCEKVFFQASIGSHKLDHEPKKTNHTTHFNCNLIWETDRSSVKNIKLENIPIKIDIYGLRSNAGNEHIGYVLIPIRSVPILPLSKALQAKCRWYKLIGLSTEWRAHRPEIHLNAMITSSSFMTCEREKLESENQERKKPASTTDSIVLDENPNPCMMMSSQKGMFIRVLQSEGLLQVGSIDTNADIFNVKLVLKSIKQLGGLLEKCELPTPSDPELFINYILLGNNHSRKLDKKFNRTYKIQEKISINFRSSLRALHEYFDEVFYIPLELFLDSKMIGSVEIRLNKLIDVFNLEEFLERYPKALELNETVDISTAFPLKDDETRPFIEYTVVIQYQASRQLHQVDLLKNYKASCAIDTKAGGDFTQKEVTPREDEFVCEPKAPSKPELDEMHVSPLVKSNEENQTDAAETALKSAAIVPELKKEIPHLFCYYMHIHSLKFNKRPGKGIWQASLYHERADTKRVYANRQVSEEDIAADNEIIFEGLVLKLYFTAHVAEIEDVVQAQPHVCTLCIKGPYSTHIKANLDCNNLMIVSSDKSTGNILLSNPDPSDSTTAYAQVSVSISDEGFNLNSVHVNQECNDENASQTSKDENAERNKMLFDENIAFNMIMELEQWKNAEREKFIQDLKRAEQLHLEKIKGEFEQKTKCYEQHINEKKSALDELTKSVENAKKSLDMRSMTVNNEEKVQYELIKIELEKTYQEKFAMIRAQSNSMKQDLEQQLSRKDCQIAEIEASNSQFQAKIHDLQHEIFHLRESVEDLKNENESLKTTFVPKFELESLLKELKSLKETYDQVEGSKLFYKEQWAKLFRENNKVRQATRNSIRDDIFEAKYEQFYDAVSDEFSLLNFDKDELDEIKMHLNVK